MKLISITDFVMNQYYKEKQDSYSFEIKCVRYANLLEQPLKLEMFVPCDDKGCFLEEPEFHEPNSENEIGDYDELRYQYQQSKQKVLFEGFQFTIGQRFSLENNIALSVHPYTDERIYITKRKGSESHSWFNLYTIEDLVQCELDLTQSAINTLGL